MPRKLKPVTLAASSRDRVAHGHYDATPERIRHARAAGEARIDRGVRRIGDGFDVLRNRNQLDRLDIVANERLWHAGDRYRRHWHGARVERLSAVDLTRPRVDGGSVGGGPSDAAGRHRNELRRAAEAVGGRLMPYLEGVVIEGRPLSALRGLVGDSGHPRTADALVLERLREALHRLCDLWRMRSDARPLPLAAWRDDVEPRPGPGQDPG